jgi:hypothetical protein
VALSASTNRGTIYGLFCLDAFGVGTHEQGSVSGYGAVVHLGTTTIAVLGEDLLLAGSEGRSYNQFTEVAPEKAYGTFGVG